MKTGAMMMDRSAMMGMSGMMGAGMAPGMGVGTGIDLDRLVDCARLASTLVGHEVPSKYYRAAIGARSRSSLG